MPKKTTTKTVKTPIYFRNCELSLREDSKESREVDLSFSSDSEIERYSWGEKYIEILDHNPKSVRMNFLNSGRAQLLRNHDTNDYIGVIKSAKIGSDRVGRATVRFGKSSRAEEEFQDVVDGIRQNISVGYRIHKLVQETESDDEPNVYRAVDWEPLEISTVSIPADSSVGVGRSAEDSDSRTFKTQIITTREGNVMTPEELEAKRQADEGTATSGTAGGPKVIESKIDVDKVRADSTKSEQNRASNLLAIGEMSGYQREAAQAIKDGKSVDEFRSFLVDELIKKKVVTTDEPDPTIGLSKKETKSYSLIRLAKHLSEPNNQRFREEAGFEIECSEASEKKFGKAARGAFMPWDVLVTRQLINRDELVAAARMLKRDINTTDDASLIGTEHLAGSFIDVLRNRARVIEAGARLIPGLVGNVSIPKKTAASTMYWVAEGITTNPTESEATYGAVTLSPNTAGTYTEITRQMMNQSSPAIDQLTKDDLAATMGVGLDASALHGAGGSDPTGIAATSGIGSVVGGTNGAAPDHSDIVALETAVAVDNADLGALAYMVNAQTRGKLKNTLITATYGDRFVWNSQSPNTPLNGYPTFVTNQVSSTLTKGSSTSVASAIFFGNWNDLLIGMWGTLDILVDPYTYSKSGGILIRALQDIDIAVRHAESFAAMLDALSA